LMLFGFRFLKQVMFGEETIAMKADALDKRLARKRELEAFAAAHQVETVTAEADENSCSDEGCCGSEG